MKNKFKILLFLFLLFCSEYISAQKVATDSLAIDTVTIGNTKEFEYTNKKSTKKENIHWDSHIRLRHELWDNQEDLNDTLDDLFSFFRLKVYLGAGFQINENMEIYARVVNESRYYGYKGTGDTITTDQTYRPQRNYFELVIGQLYFKWKNVAELPLTLTVGRQNLHNQGFGNQWLIGDGTPLDGSKTFYYNALRINYQFKNKSTIDAVGLVSFAEDPIVIFSEIEKTVTNITDEQGAWLWFKHKLNNKIPYSAFYIYKHENGGGGFHRTKESNIHTLGLHIKPESKNYWLDGQITAQGGNYGNVSRTGFGTMIYGGYQYKEDTWSVKAGPWFMYLTGDNPETENFEAFNNLFGGYPNDDELYLNTWAAESGTSMWTNISLYGAYVEYMPTPKFNIRFWYHLMQTNQLESGNFFGQGKSRGQMIMLKAMGEFGEKLKAYYMFQYLWTGDYYFTGADNAILSRINLEWYF